jgi:hypothetical protein
MKCPKCHNYTIVADTRKVNGGRERKRRCSNGHITYTKEVIVEKWDYIDRRSGRYRRKPLTKTPKKKEVKPKKPAAPKKIKTPERPQGARKWTGLKITDETPMWVKKLWDRTL